MSIFNSAALYAAKFSKELVADFNEKFPGLADKMAVAFSNDPKGKEYSWADSIMIHASMYNFIFQMYLTKAPGNCGLAIVSGLSVNDQFQHHGVGLWSLKWAAQMLADMGFTVAIGTTNQHQQAMERLLPKAGWQEVNSVGFKNRRTHNNIRFWQMTLPEPRKKK